MIGGIVKFTGLIEHIFFYLSWLSGIKPLHELMLVAFGYSNTKKALKTIA